LAIVKRPRHTQGFQVLQWRWIVERMFGWLHRLQRLSKDFEVVPATTETWIRIAMIHLDGEASHSQSVTFSDRL